MGLAGRMASAESDDEDEDKLTGSGTAPVSYTSDVAKRWVRLWVMQAKGIWAVFVATRSTTSSLLALLLSARCLVLMCQLRGC